MNTYYIGTFCVPIHAMFLFVLTYILRQRCITAAKYMRICGIFTQVSTFMYIYKNTCVCSNKNFALIAAMRALCIRAYCSR